MKRSLRVLAMAGAALTVGVAGVGVAEAATTTTTFDLVRSTASLKAGCLTRAEATAKIYSIGPVEVMRISAEHLPKNTDFDLFVTQVPDAPFGLSWYQGDLRSDSHGNASGIFVGRFSTETFTVAPGSTVAPDVHHGRDAVSNPATLPVHQFHLGVWFNSPKDAVAAGCLGATTPFNGDHTAGVQALSTRNFPATAGPLARVKP